MVFTERFDLALAQKQVKTYLSGILRPEDAGAFLLADFRRWEVSTGLAF